MARLFVYGSLKRGFSNAALLEGAPSLGAQETAEGFALVRYQGGFPALFREQAGRGRVSGEVYVVGSALLVELDAFEEVPDLYQREEIELDDGGRAFAYCIPGDVAASWPQLPSGLWLEE